MDGSMEVSGQLRPLAALLSRRNPLSSVLWRLSGPQILSVHDVDKNPLTYLVGNRNAAIQHTAIVLRHADSSNDSNHILNEILI
jgi:hypothetical protein